jgi:hypothetical protein
MIDARVWMRRTARLEGEWLTFEGAVASDKPNYPSVRIASRPRAVTNPMPVDNPCW